MLLTGPELADAKRWAGSHAEEIEDFEVRFLAASADRDIAERKSRRLSVVIRGLVAAFLLGMTSLTLLAVRSCNRAEEQRIKAEQERSKADEQRLQAERISAEFALDRGRAACERGNVGRGLLFMARSLQLAPPDTTILQQSIRIQLSRWISGFYSLENALDHNKLILSVAFSPDGKTILTGSDDEIARLWDAGTGKLLMTLPRQAAVRAVAFSPDGKTILTGSGLVGSGEGLAQVWEASTGKLRRNLPHQGPVFAVAFSPDGKTVLTGSGLGERGKVWPRCGRRRRANSGGTYRTKARSLPWPSALTARPS